MNIEVEFLVTSFCQAKCPSCIRTIMIENNALTPKHVDIDVFKRVVKNLKNVDVVSLCGETGDPLMHPDIEKIIDLFLQKNITVFLHTNAGLRNEEFFRSLARKKVNIDFGIDGMTEEINNKYRINVDFDKAWNNMHAYFDETKKHFNKSLGKWSYIIFTWNKHTIYEVYDYAKKNKIPLNLKVNDRGSLDNPEYGYVGKEEEKKLWKIINELEK